ncbi:hypothetical protein ACFPA8_21820 [Streptomyces ovatisporus]|uniref:Secreted protein n=1 Tax=Streptomyces ovatisporus TaxID=1128682 RepID=A0ABV9AAS0_9ACTN
MLSCGFALGALLLFTVGPDVEYGHDSYSPEYRLEAECASIAAVGWEDGRLDLDGSAVNHTFSMSPDDLDELAGLEEAQKGDSARASEQIAADCDRRRTRNAALMSVLLAPGAVFAGLAVRGGGRREQEGTPPAPGAPPSPTS